MTFLYGSLSADFSLLCDGVCKSFDPSEPLFLLENGANIDLSPGSLCKEKCADWMVSHKCATGGASFFRQA